MLTSPAGGGSVVQLFSAGEEVGGEKGDSSLPTWSRKLSGAEKEVGSFKTKMEIFSFDTICVTSSIIK